MVPQVCRLTHTCLQHMAGILTEDPPQNVYDVQELIGEYLRNGGKLTTEESN